jgi:hypothetical protein
LRFAINRCENTQAPNGSQSWLVRRFFLGEFNRLSFQHGLAVLVASKRDVSKNAFGEPAAGTRLTFE